MNATTRGDPDWLQPTAPEPPPARPPAPRRRGPVGFVLRVLGVLASAVDGFFRHHGTQHAAGIAYRILFSLAPLAIVLVAVLGLVLRNDSLRSDVVDLIVRHLPLTEHGVQQAEDAIVSIASPVSALGFLSLLVFAWAASGMMAAIRMGLEAALEVTHSRPAARAKLVDLLLVVGASVLVLVVAGLTFLGEVLRTEIDDATSVLGSGVGAALIQHLVVLLLFAVVALLLYRFVPARRIRFVDAVAGSIVTAVLLLGISLASGWLYTQTTQLSLVYGSLTAALVFLYSVYLYACAVLLGAEVASAWSRPPSPSPEPFFTQLRRVVRDLFVQRERPAGLP